MKTKFHGKHKYDVIMESNDPKKPKPKILYIYVWPKLKVIEFFLFLVYRVVCKFSEGCTPEFPF